MDIEFEEKKQLIADESGKLMRKSLWMIISFFTLLVVCIVLFFLLQDNKFFIFNLNRTFDNVPSPLISEIFSLFFIVIIFGGFISYVFFAIAYFKRRRQDGDELIKSYRSFKKTYNFADIFSVVPVFLVIVMIINGFFFSFAQVDGISMEPTFCDRDAVIIRYVDAYQKDDIVILEIDNVYLIKRLIAGPGDQLVVNTTGVYVNGILVEDTIANGNIGYNTVIEEGEYYVMGDNREHSQDSRYFGLVDQEQLLGKVIYRISGSSCDVS